MNTRPFFVLLALSTLLVPAAPPAVGAAPADDDQREARTCEIIAGMQPLPCEAAGAAADLLAFAADERSGLSLPRIRPFVEFIVNACTADSGWELPERDGAEGAAYVVKMGVPLSQYLALNFHPGIPDYAVFQTSLRYSACLDTNDMQRAYARIGAGPTGLQEYVAAHVSGMEEITPNPESGSYFSYTNSRVFLRCTIDGRDVLFSCSKMTAPSTFSQRGVPVGPLGQAVFYYSEKPGLNLKGMTWMLSQIAQSTTISVCIALSSNETAVATLAWLKAGWKGMNVTRSSHILNSQINTLEFTRRITQDPNVSAARIAAIVDEVNGMSPADIDAHYEQYLGYVRTRCGNGKKGLFRGDSLLEDLFNPKANENMPLTHRRALLVQERVRTLMGIPTWSALPAKPATTFQ